ncbi:MAG TPA: N-acetylmuramoyl-L-alanine amidase [Candidatus Choladousia intestinigallinarum]|nr:N-acetylmuramoyl-L-alanine amidase [Candidatus Choladousia intestinigallinarum]
MRKRVCLVVLLCLMALTVAGSTVAFAAEDETSASAAAAKKRGWVKSGKYTYYYTSSGKMVTGWKKISGKIYYFRTEASGSKPEGSMVTGWLTIGSRKYYFSSKGVMQTGWKTIKNKNYYFRPTGKAGIMGSMYTGFKKIGSNRFLFKDDGSITVGWTTYNNKRYFFSNSKKLGTRGRALTGWKAIGKYKYYFSSTGVLQKNRWINGKYYVDSNGRMLKNTVTPDGYKVNSNGVKTGKAKGWIKSGGKYYYYVSGKKVTGWKTIGGKRYYFDKNGVRQNGLKKIGSYKYYFKSGVMQKGWQTINGKKYYFKTNGRMAVNTTVGGIKIGSDGVAETSVSVLIISGHGQGDVGATARYGSSTYYEYKYTRQFATLIYNNLKSSGKKISVTMYDQDYDCYQVVAGKKNGPDPNFKNYDYVLEIHFNATAVSAKDLSGDGSYKGVGMYVNSSKSNTSIDRQIVKAVGNTGFRIWGGGTGIFTSSGLLNAKTCQKQGVSYGLLETAFIDDKDDMKFYNSNKNKMAKAVANAILNYFDL